MSKVFSNNLLSIRQANRIVAIFAGVFSVYPILIEKDLLKALVYLATALIAFLIALFANYKMQTELVNNKFIYILTTVYYANIMLFGIFLGVWKNNDTNTYNYAVTFMCILICALSLFINPPIFNLCLTLISMAIFSAATIILKPYQYWSIDVCNMLFAGFISLFLNWHISKLRMGMELSTTLLEDERNKYHDQSIIDELTQLRNRRDYMNTFHRFLFNYRASDDWLCVAIADIDFFKNYNDHYGHPKGDDCLRSIGEVLNNLRDTMGIYVARVGGEEFSMLWFEKDAANVNSVVANLTKQIRELNISHEKSKISEYVTMSIGVYVVRCGVYTNTQILYDLADKALYAAKAGGRNCAVINGDDIKEYKISG